ncbi:hypothetical protein EVAR_47733_1 [Eumeta japonica]|uniref:Uncharacterized protein n=1 Tax=Eumeta variegata TaxID=151549 RepID=A0A4C1VW58_EUMVA|nr:hypothetical protein EVAR_47733_1 [Eumeta japonica]
MTRLIDIRDERISCLSTRPEPRVNYYNIIESLSRASDGGSIGAGAGGGRLPRGLLKRKVINVVEGSRRYFGHARSSHSSPESGGGTSRFDFMTSRRFDPAPRRRAPTAPRRRSLYKSSS